MSALVSHPGRVDCSAVLSADGSYRYELRRIWDPQLPLLPVILLNPSTADAKDDDATVRILIAFARRWGFGGFVLVNLYALRSTDPRGLALADDPIGPLGSSFIRGLLGAAGVSGIEWALVGWGDGGSKLRGHAQHVRWVCKTAQACKVELRCLGKTKAGAPWHPLRKSLDLVPVRWVGHA
jgi:hypothetical protein